MRVLIIGSGAREHALGQIILRSPGCSGLYFAPGNPGTSLLGTNCDISPSDFEAIAKFVHKEQIQLLVVGPEEPLVKGISDFLAKNPLTQSLWVVGPGKAGAMLEGSKDFAKAFMEKYGIPTARYNAFSALTIEEAKAFLTTMNPPYVLKADGLAAGKGVLICTSIEEAKQELEEMLIHRKFGAASEKVVIEEFLTGTELSMFVLTDGNNYLLLPEAKDYKRIGENDTGPNTGGMGAVSPVPFADEQFISKVKQRIIRPTLQGLQKEGIPYRGFIFLGLICVEGEPFVIEYNVRLGDPEAEAVLPRIESDFLAHLVAAANGTIEDEQLVISQAASATIVMASGGYPGKFNVGYPISGLHHVNESLVYFAGVSGSSELPISNGGRVLAVTSLAPTIEEALVKSYESASRIHFCDVYFRTDIGKDLIHFLKK